jgi:hypothetical protein
MKRTAILLALLAVSLPAEEVTVKQPALLRSGRNVVSVKAGAIVELIARDGAEITIKYRDVTGKIPASKLDEPETPPPVAAPAAEKKSAAKPSPRKPGQPPPQAKPAVPAPAKPANPPQTMYGKAVQKAKENAAAHDRNVVKPADEVLEKR